MKSARYIPLLAILSALTCSHREAEAQESTSLLSFLHLPSTPHSLALGRSATSFIGESNLLALESPALLGTEHHNDLSLSYMRLSGGANMGAAFYSRRWGQRGAWGAGVRYLSYGTLSGRDREGRETGQFSAGDLAMQLTYSYDLTERLRAGITFRGLSSTIESYRAWGVGADVALSYYDDERDQGFGLTLYSLGRLFPNYAAQSQSLPWDIRLGYRQRLKPTPFVLHLGLYDLHPRRSGEFTPELKRAGRLLRHLSLGLEYLPSEQLWFAIGYLPKLAQDLRALRGSKFGGFTLGVGLQMSRYRISVAAQAGDVTLSRLLVGLTTHLGRSSGN